MYRLFDDIPRNYTKPSLRAETTYSFLNRSSHPATERIRQMLQRWIDRLPETGRKKAVANMRHSAPGSDTKEVQFYAEFFELFLHEFLVSTGAEIETQPVINNLTPDFRAIQKATDGNSITYVVEATDIDLERGTTLERLGNEEFAIDTLNEISSTDFRLYIETNGKLESPPRKRDLKRPFEDLIEEANYEEVLSIAEQQDFARQEFPKASFSHGGWTIDGYLMPVLPKYRGKTADFVINGPMKGANIDDIGKTKDKLYDKAKRYRNIDNLVIALRCDNSNDRLAEALFGSQQYTFYMHKDPTETAPLPSPHLSQKLDGFWFNSHGPQNRNVIGVVVFYDVHPWALDRAKAVYFANPYVVKPMPNWTRTITRAKYSDGKVQIVEGSTPHKFLRDFEVVDKLFD